MPSLEGYEENPKLKKTRKQLRYVLAVTLPIIIVALLQIPAFSFARSSITLLLVGAVTLSAANGGYRAGFLTTAISAVLTTYFFNPPYGFYAFISLSGVARLTLFMIEGIILSSLVDFVGRKTELGSYKEKIKELKETIEKLDGENTVLKQEIRSRDEFLSIASHELKTPLTSMLLQTQHALHSIKNVSLAQFSIESLLKMLETVENQTKRLSRMINDLLNISLITTGNMNLEYEKVELNTLVGNVIEEFSNRLKRDNIQIALIEENVLEGSWDKLRMEQAITNLLSNAIRYGENRPIEVVIKKYYNNAKISVTDQGIGINKANQKKIFDLFERGVAQESYKGLGVGLFITKQIVDAHHGSLIVDSKEGHGSIFTIEVPIFPPDTRPTTTSV